MRLKFWKYCYQCKSTLEDKAAFCHQCGAKNRRYGAIATILILIPLVWLVLFLLLKPEEQPSARLKHSEKSTAETSEDAPVPTSIQTIETLLQDPQANDAHLRQAIDQLNSLLETYPNFAYGLRLRASLFSLLRNPAQAVRTYQIYLEKFPDDAHSRLALAKAFFQSERTQDALAECQALYEKYPQFIGVLRTLQQIHEQLGNTALALEFQTRYMAAKKENDLSQQPPRVFHSKDPLKP